MPAYRSRTSTHGRNMAGARGLWRATGMKDGDFGKPIIAIANSFTQFVPGHVHLKDMGQLVAREVEAAGAQCHVPFPPLPPAGPDAPAADWAERIRAHANADRTVGVLLVRLGGYAAGVFTGPAARL